MNSIYTERENILPHHAEWLDGCGAKWCDGEDFSKQQEIAKYVLFSDSGAVEDDGYYFFNEDNPKERWKHIPDPEEFCERVAEILGVEKPVFEQFGNSEQVDISKTETTTDHIPYVGEKVDEQDKLFPGRNNTMGEGSLTQEDIHTLLGDKVSPSYKTYRILDSLDGIPLDKRIPLSEWIPPFGEEVLILSKFLKAVGHVKAITNGNRITFWMNHKADMNLDLDGHWMRIV